MFRMVIFCITWESTEERYSNSSVLIYLLVKINFMDNELKFDVRGCGHFEHENKLASYSGGW